MEYYAIVFVAMHSDVKKDEEESKEGTLIRAI